MMRACNLDTCPVGIATQNPELRRRFTGKPEYVENFMRFVARELREYMARLGVRTVNELVGRTDLIKVKEELAAETGLDFSRILAEDSAAGQDKVYDPARAYHYELEKTIDERVFLKKLKKTLETGQKASLDIEVTNVDRALGTIFGAEITRRFGDTLEDDTCLLYTSRCV